METETPRSSTAVVTWLRPAAEEVEVTVMEGEFTFMAFNSLVSAHLCNFSSAGRHCCWFEAVWSSTEFTLNNIQVISHEPSRWWIRSSLSRWREELLLIIFNVSPCWPTSLSYCKWVHGTDVLINSAYKHRHTVWAARIFKSLIKYSSYNVSVSTF